MRSADEAARRLGVPQQSYGALALYEPVRVANAVAYVSGHGPLSPDGQIVVSGRVGEQVSQADAVEAARLAGCNMLSRLRQAVGTLGPVQAVLRIRVFILTTTEFGDQPEVGDGVSELLLDVFGRDVGAHARTTMGVFSNPRDVTVSVDGGFLVGNR